MLLSVIDCAASTFKPDSLFLKPFSRKVSIRSMIGIKEFSFSISSNPEIENHRRISYKPNNGLIGGIGVSYNNILLSYYFKIPRTELNANECGKTSTSDYQINLTNRYVYLSAYHRKYSGFYVTKPQETYPDWEAGMQYPLRPDIKYTTKGIETIISLNPRKYSLNASIKLTEQQLRSVFSTLLYANYTVINIHADSSLIPIHLRNYFFEGSDLFKSSFYGWSIQPGITYSFVKSKWFFNPMFFAGFGHLQKDLYFTDMGSKRYKDYYFRISTKFNCGYNSKQFFTGIFFDWNEMFLPEKNLMIKTENLNVMLVAGFRF